MQTLLNIAFGALVAGASLGPAAWADISNANTRLVHTVSAVAGFEQDAQSPLDHAMARARASLPHLPHGAH